MVLEAKIMLGLACVVAFGGVLLLSVLSHAKKRADKNIDAMVEEQVLNRNPMPVKEFMRPVRVVEVKKVEKAEIELSPGEKRRLERNKRKTL